MSDNQGKDWGALSYSKPSGALTLLRETILGQELFDKAFKEYAQRWAFKHPKPADFFRTMEDASAVDLDWFWRGWFYTTDNVDVTLDEVKWMKVKQSVTDPEKKSIKTQQGDLSATSSKEKANDFSNDPSEFVLTKSGQIPTNEFLSKLNEGEIRATSESKNFYQLTFKNSGGLVSPIIIEWTYKDGSKEIEKIPAEIWRTNEAEFTKVFVKEKEVTNIVIDPNEETADVNTSDNVFPKKASANKFDQFKKVK